MNSTPKNLRLDTIEGIVEIIDIALLDGGRTSFNCQNRKREFWIRVVTNGFEDLPYEDGYWPGGLYFNEELIEFDSNEEKLIIAIIRKLDVSEAYLSYLHKDKHRDEVKSTMELVKGVLDFIESDKYTFLAKKTGRIKKNNI